jgi:hypothetical protein
LERTSSTSFLLNENLIQVPFMLCQLKDFSWNMYIKTGLLSIAKSVTALFMNILKKIIITIRGVHMFKTV